MPKLNGIVETALYVADLERAGAFYERVFSLRPLLADDRMRAYGVADRNVLLLFLIGGSKKPSDTPGGVIPPHDARGNIHFAFAISADDVSAWERHLAEHRVALESKVVCDNGKGGDSLYLRDPDNNLVELITPNCWAINKSPSFFL